MTPLQFQSLVVVGILLFYALLDLVRGRFFTAAADREDNRLDVAVMMMFPLVSGGVSIVAVTLCQTFMPEQAGALAHWPWWAMVLTLLVVDDLTQYFWHRLSHTSVLWPLHRAHHSASYMSVRVVYRNNALYYAMMPGLWLSAMFGFLGFSWVYVCYVMVKLTVIAGAHCSLPWDAPLYRIPALRPVMWILERTISTPATHWAHHALAQDDGVGHYSGNFGNLLFLWDVIFGTARITRRYPPAFGLADDRAHGHEKWYTQMLFPLSRSRRAESALVWPPGRPPA